MHTRTFKASECGNAINRQIQSEIKVKNNPLVCSKLTMGHFSRCFLFLFNDDSPAKKIFSSIKMNINKINVFINYSHQILDTCPYLSISKY